MALTCFLNTHVYFYFIFFQNSYFSIKSSDTLYFSLVVFFFNFFYYIFLLYLCVVIKRRGYMIMCSCRHLRHFIKCSQTRIGDEVRAQGVEV